MVDDLLATGGTAEAGITLISMMIGLVISSLSILAMLSLYRNLVHQAADSIVHSNLDGQVAAGLLTAQIELQSAGFGIASAAVNQDLMLLAGASLTPGGMLSGTIQNILGSEQEGEAIVWGSDPTRSAYLCSALLAEDGGLILLRGVPCTRAIQFSSADCTAMYDSSTRLNCACGLSSAQAIASTPLPQPRSATRA